LWKEEEFVKRAPWKPKSHRQRDSHRKSWDNNKLWTKSHHQRDSHTKAGDNNKLWPKSHRQRDSHQKGSRQQWVVAWVKIMIINGDCSQSSVCVDRLKISWYKFMKTFHGEYIS
jgi:hypothetical protein